MKNKIFNTYIVYIIHIVHSTSVPKIDTTNSENHISEQDPNILSVMVSHYECAKQNNSRQFSLLIVEPCKQAPSVIQHKKTQATVYVEQNQKELKPSNVKHILKLKKFGVHKHFHLVHDLIVYNGNKIH